MLDPGIHVDAKWHKPSAQRPWQIKHNPIALAQSSMTLIPSMTICKATPQKLLSSSLWNTVLSNDLASNYLCISCATGEEVSRGL